MIGNVVRFLHSIRLLLILLVIIGIISCIGIVVPQDWTVELYEKKYGLLLTRALLFFQLHRIFSSPLFIITLFIFLLNLGACTVTRALFLLSILRSKWPMEKQSTKERWSITGLTQQEAAHQVSLVLNKKGYQVFSSHDSNKHTSFAHKGTFGVVGSLVLHVGLFALVISSMVQYYRGDSQNFILDQRKESRFSKFGFSISLDTFAIEQDNSGALSNYASHLTLVDANDTIVANGVSRVNKPFRYRDYYFYQSHYGSYSDSVEQIKLMVTQRSSKDTLYYGPISFNQSTPCNDSTFMVRCSAFLSDFVYNTQTKKVFSRSHEHNNPAFFITLSRKDSLVSARWHFLKIPVMHRTDEEFTIKILSYKPIYFSGITIKKSPATNAILGCLLVVSCGLIGVFLFPFRAMAIQIFKKGEGLELSLYPLRMVSVGEIQQVITALKRI